MILLSITPCNVRRLLFHMLNAMAPRRQNTKFKGIPNYWLLGKCHRKVYSRLSDTTFAWGIVTYKKAASELKVTICPAVVHALLHLCIGSYHWSEMHWYLEGIAPYPKLNLILTLKPTLKQPFEEVRTSQNICTFQKCPPSVGSMLKMEQEHTHGVQCLLLVIIIP